MLPSVRRFARLFLLALVIFGTISPLTDGVSAQDSDQAAQTTDVSAPTATVSPDATEGPADTTPAIESPSAVTTEEAPTDAATTPQDTATETPVQPTTPPVVETAVPTKASTQPAEKTATAALKSATSTAKATSTKQVSQASAPKTSSVTAAVTLSKSSGAVGTSVTASIVGFPKSATLTITWDGAKLGTVKTNSSGAASYGFKAPASISGSHKLLVAASGHSRSASFKITPKLSVSPTSASVGKSVTITLSGFAKSESVSVMWGSSKIKTATVGATGGWSGSITVPKTPSSGSVTVKGNGGSGTSASTTFKVTSSTTPTPTSTASAGSVVVKLLTSGSAALSGGCFTIYHSANGARGSLVTRKCDSDDSATDGTTTFSTIAAGSYVLSETQTPSNYLPSADIRFTVTSSSATTLSVSNAQNSGLTVVKTDENGAPLVGSCFSVYTNIGGGDLGDLKKSACDDSDEASDGVIHLGDIATNNYVLVEKVVPTGYARADQRSFAFTSGGSKLITVQDTPGGAIVASVVNEAGDGVSGACVDAYVDLGGGALGNFVDRACNDNGSKVTVDGLKVGNYYLVQSHAPAGYTTAVNTKFSIVAKKDSSVTIVDLPTTKVVIRKKNPADQPLSDACFSVYKASGGTRGANVYSDKCDNNDGKSDGYTTLPLSPGSYVLAETKAPVGYLIGGDVKFSIASGLDTALDVIDQPGGTALITDVDSADLQYIPTGACFAIWNQGSGNRIKLGTACDIADGHTDGVVRIVGLPTGSLYLEQTTTPKGYFTGTPMTISITAGQTTDVTFVNEHWPWLIIHKVDENGDPLGGACFTAFVDLGGGQHGAEWQSPNGKLCDTNKDGELAAWVTPGNQVLVETTSPLGYLPIQETPFVMVRGQVTELTVQDFKAGVITVHKTDKDGKVLTGACFSAYVNVKGTRGSLITSSCDQGTNDPLNKTLDGATVLNGFTPGNYLVAEKTAPSGYFTAPDVPVTVSGAMTTITVADEAWPVLTVSKVDDTNAPVKGACFWLYTVKNGGRGLPYRSQVCSGGSSTLKISAAPGTYLLAESVTPSGYQRASDISVTYVRGTNGTISVVDKPNGFVKVIDHNEIDKPLPGACWQLLSDNFGKPGSSLLTKCSSTASNSDGSATIEAKPGKYWIRQSTVPKGYKKAADQAITIVARQTLTVTVKSDPYPRLVVNSVDQSNHPLTGACFDIYIDGGDSLGTKVETNLCDKADGANDGSTTRRLEPGRYVAKEVTAPSGYVIASNIKFTIVADTDLVLKLTHQLAGILSVQTQDRAALILKGACFEVWTKLDGGAKGVLVTKNCDKDSGDVSSTSDGTTLLKGLPAGSFILSESFAPTGYAKSADQTVTVVAGSTVTVVVINDKP